MEKWNGIMKAVEVNHFGRDGTLLHREENRTNIMHTLGEEFILKVLFQGQAIPANYYLGLDFRSVLEKSQTISDVFGWEPSSNAYSRNPIPSGNFTITTTSGSVIRQANSPALLFRASGGSWGPVRNIFMSTNLGYGNNSVLISSVPLSTSITVADGEIITMRMAMALSDCSL